MKKILFATTALVASASFASAEVKLTGYAEIGIKGGESYSTTTGLVSSGKTQFHDDIDVSFNLSGETDTGLSFGAKIDLDEVNASAALGGTGSQKNAVWVKGAFGSITLGDTDGALDWAMQETDAAGNPGSLADNETAHLGFFGSYLDGMYDGQILRYDNTFGNFGVAISAELDDTPSPGDVDNGFAIGLKYTASLSGVDVTFGGGYQVATAPGTYAPAPFSVPGLSGVAPGDKLEAIGVSALANFENGFVADIAYTKIDGPATVNDVDHLGIGVGYKSGPLSLHANWGKYDIATVGDRTGYGVAVGYDLGGSASVLAGYGHSEDPAGTSFDNWSIGLGLSF